MKYTRYVPILVVILCAASLFSVANDVEKDTVAKVAKESNPFIGMAEVVALVCCLLCLSSCTLIFMTSSIVFAASSS